MAKRRGMSKRRGSRKFKTIKRRSKYHQGRKRSRANRMRRGRKRMSRRVIRSGGGKESRSPQKRAPRFAPYTLRPQRQPAPMPQDLLDLNSLPKSPTLDEFIPTIGGKINDIQDYNTPVWSNNKWIPGGNMDYGFINLQQLAKHCIDNNILEQILDTNSFENDDGSVDPGPETEKYQKTFGDCIIVMSLSSDDILEQLVNFSRIPSYATKLAKILGTTSSRNKYPLDNLKTMGDVAFSGSPATNFANIPQANITWCTFMKGTEWPGKQFYDIKRLNDVIKKVNTIITNCKLNGAPLVQYNIGKNRVVDGGFLATNCPP